MWATLLQLLHLRTSWLGDRRPDSSPGAPSGPNPQAADNPHVFPPVLTPWSGSGTGVLESLPPATSGAPASPPQPERSVGTQRNEAQLGWVNAGRHLASAAGGLGGAGSLSTNRKGRGGCGNSDAQTEGPGLILTPALCGTKHVTAPPPRSVSSLGGHCTHRFRISFQLQSLVILQCSGKAREADAALEASTVFVQIDVIFYLGPPGREMI